MYYGDVSALMSLPNIVPQIQRKKGALVSERIRTIYIKFITSIKYWISS